MMPNCPQCGDSFHQSANLNRHMYPAHGWTLNDSRKDYLKEQFSELDGDRIRLVTWNHEGQEREVFTGRLECDRLSNTFYTERGEIMVQWLGGHGPVGGFWLHMPETETDRLGLPDPSRRVIDALPIERVKVEIGDETTIERVQP